MYLGKFQELTEQQEFQKIRFDRFSSINNGYLFFEIPLTK